MIDTGRLGKCLLIGMSGFVGGRLLCALQSNKSKVIECVLLPRKHLTSLKGNSICAIQA